jgi:hypothetical protein
MYFVLLLCQHLCPGQAFQKRQAAAAAMEAARLHEIAAAQAAAARLVAEKQIAEAR